MISPQAHRGLRPSTCPPTSTTTWHPHAGFMQFQRSLAFIRMTSPALFAPSKQVPRANDFFVNEAVKYRVVTKKASITFVGPLACRGWQPEYVGKQNSGAEGPGLRGNFIARP